jgi:undecaprenyl diphosphate synthase
MIQHLACIMDGNRRWAKKHGLMQVGKEGIETAYKVVEWCIEKQIPYLSLFAFSLENFKRSPLEFEPLFALMVEEMIRRTDELKNQSIAIRFIGDRTQFPLLVRNACTHLEEATSFGTRIQVHIFFCYGSCQEIVDTCKRIAMAVTEGTLSTDMIVNTTFERYLWTSGIPDPELIIRTGGVQRLSNFMLYQAAYAELFFLDALWPDMTPTLLEDALHYYSSCRRNFGQ